MRKKQNKAGCFRMAGFGNKVKGFENHALGCMYLKGILVMQQIVKSIIVSTHRIPNVI